MHETRHRYIVVEDSPPRLRKATRTFLIVVMLILATLYFLGFFWAGSAPLESEIQIEGRR